MLRLRHTVSRCIGVIAVVFALPLVSVLKADEWSGFPIVGMDYYTARADYGSVSQLWCAAGERFSAVSSSSSGGRTFKNNIYYTVPTRYSNQVSIITNTSSTGLLFTNTVTNIVMSTNSIIFSPTVSPRLAGNSNQVTHPFLVGTNWTFTNELDEPVTQQISYNMADYMPCFGDIFSGLNSSKSPLHFFADTNRMDGDGSYDTWFSSDPTAHTNLPTIAGIDSNTTPILLAHGITNGMIWNGSGRYETMLASYAYTETWNPVTTNFDYGTPAYYPGLDLRIQGLGGIGAWPFSVIDNAWRPVIVHVNRTGTNGSPLTVIVSGFDTNSTQIAETVTLNANASMYTMTHQFAVVTNIETYSSTTQTGLFFNIYYPTNNTPQLYGNILADNIAGSGIIYRKPKYISSRWYDAGALNDRFKALRMLSQVVSDGAGTGRWTEVVWIATGTTNQSWATVTAACDSSDPFSGYHFEPSLPWLMPMTYAYGRKIDDGDGTYHYFASKVLRTKVMSSGIPDRLTIGALGSSYYPAWTNTTRSSDVYYTFETPSVFSGENAAFEDFGHADVTPPSVTKRNSTVTGKGYGEYGLLAIPSSFESTAIPSGWCAEPTVVGITEMAGFEMIRCETINRFDWRFP